MDNLGDITVNTARLEGQCLSRERLAAGKALVEELLGELIVHRRDHFEEFKPAGKGAGTARPKPATALPAEVDRALQEEVFAQQMERILNQPIPQLGGQTARAAAETAEAAPFWRNGSNPWNIWLKKNGWKVNPIPTCRPSAVNWVWRNVCLAHHVGILVSV